MILADANMQLWVLDLEHLKQKPIKNVGPARRGAWSADGRAYAFMRMGGRSYQLVVVILGSNNLQPSVLVPSFVGTCASFGNGWMNNRVLFGRYGNLAPQGQNSFAIYSVAAMGGPVRLEVPPGVAPPPVGEAMWLNQGEVGYPTVQNGSQYAIVDVHSKKPRTITIKADQKF